MCRRLAKCPVLNWYAMDDLIAAGQLATMLLAFVLVVVLAERAERRRSRFHNSRRVRELPRTRLSPLLASLSFAACLIPVLLGFIIPILMLLNLHVVDGHNLMSDRYGALISNSLILAGTAALAAVAAALIIAYAARLSPGWLTGAAGRIASLGYAVPGSVIAIGILLPMANVDNAIDHFMQSTFGVSTGLVITGSIAALILAYVTRFMAVALNTVEASLGRIAP